MEWKNLYRGLIMGAADVVPGVSGGTIALLLGIYDRLITSINKVFSKEWKQQLGFLIPLGIGMVAAIFLLANGIKWLFNHYPRPTQFAFIGLIIGVMPLLLKKSDAKVNFKWQHLLLLLISAVVAAGLSLLQGDEAFIIAEIDLITYVFLFFSGFIASAAMILPGISGSLILLLVGAYGTVIHAVTELQLDILVVVALGIGLGVITMSKIVSYCLKQYPLMTYAVIIGLVIGSIYVVFPGWPIDGIDTIFSSLAFLLGLAFAYVLGRVEYQES
ncbi:DUF368 domain-containing protein [Amphibacillus sp. Q70]|uniref:DUF368 domain-containing protein n=1 Tax=Amphibacillus sp. Q70 TaxID=3453416 RepID=UPI003F86BE79